MNTGDKIKLFEDTDKRAYIDLIHDMGFNCQAKNGYILVGTPRKYSFDEKKAIGRKITRAMKEKNMSREDLANVLGLTKESTVWNWQTGKNVPSKFNQELLEQVLGIQIRKEKP